MKFTRARELKPTPELCLQSKAKRREMADTIPTLSISAEKVCFIVVKAREFDVKDVLTDEDDGSNAADDGWWRSSRIIPMTQSSRNSRASSQR